MIEASKRESHRRAGWVQVLLIPALSLLSACGEDEPTPSPIDALVSRALDGLGGRLAFESLETFKLQSSGERSFSDEGPTPDGPPTLAHNFENVQSFEVSTRSFRVDVERTVRFGGLAIPQSFSEVVLDTRGHISGVESLAQFPTGDLSSDRRAAISRQQRLLNPHLILRALLDGRRSASLGDSETVDGRDHDVLLVSDDIAPLELFVDQQTNTITKLVTREHHPLRRDVEIEVSYQDWTQDSEVSFPLKVQLKMDGQTNHDEVRSSVETNVALDASVLAFPDGASPQFVAAEAARGELLHNWHRSFASVGAPIGGIQSNVEAVELAPGVHHLMGGSHHSMVIEQQNGLVVFDAPLYDERCDAILNWIEDEIGRMPITHVVLSHHHQDHVACARTLAARGAALVVGETARGLWTSVLERPSTLVPDQLSSAPVSARILTVSADGSLMLEDDRNPIRVFGLPTDHSHDMLVPVLEQSGISFVVDIFNPGNGGFSFIVGGPQELLASFQALGLMDTITTLAGGHGASGPLSELVNFGM